MQNIHLQEVESLYKIIVVLVGVLVGSWILFGYLVARFVNGIDKKFDELFERTKDLPAIRNDIDWIKDIRKKE